MDNGGYDTGSAAMYEAQAAMRRIGAVELAVNEQGMTIITIVDKIQELVDAINHLAEHCDCQHSEEEVQDG